MFQYNILQTQWLILALGGGLALVLIVALSYLAVWRPRHPPGKGGRTASKATLQFIPWILIITYVIIMIYYVVGSTMRFEG